MSALIVKIKLILLLFTLLFASTIHSHESNSLARCRIIIMEAGSKEILPLAPCMLIPSEKTDKGKTYTSTSDEEGVCIFKNIPEGKYTLQVFYMGQTFSQPNIDINNNTQNEYQVYVNFNPINLGEVIISASESKGLSASSKIGREAIKHIQPSSIGDLLELLPGGRAKDPTFSSPQSIRIREASPIEKYNTSSLGTQFVIDGIPLNNDANLQATPAYSAFGSSYINNGVDMRAIGTDNIESVEIIRGIPSVEYGDLTSGLVKIERKRGGNTLEARFKSDMSSKLFAIAKAFEFEEKNKLSLNTDINYLDARSNPRNTRQSYKRLTGSIRMRKIWADREDYLYTLNGSIDYTGSFDNQKSDKDIDMGDSGPIERYKSNYNQTIFKGQFILSAKEEQFFRKLDINTSVITENSTIDRWKYVVLGTPTPLSTNLEEGGHDVTIVPNRYDATLKVEGKPFYAYINAMSTFQLKNEMSQFDFKAGINWDMSKNYGKGTVFDPNYPFSVDMNVRPRSFNSIPAKHQISAFIENNSTLKWGHFKINWMAGIRAMTLLNLSNAYELQGKLLFDPRLNLRVELPHFTFLNKKLDIGLGVGAGWHTKLPTLDQLYPEDIYYDITQLNYWPTDASKRRINVLVNKINSTNYALRAARNFKWEIRGDFEWDGYSLSVTYFEEDMKSGFRDGSQPIRYIYKDYDEQAIDFNTLTGPPSLETTPFVMDTILTVHSFKTNGSRTLKKGVEFTLSTPRIQAIYTKFSLNGAWFRTNYRNSQPEYYRPTVVINNKAYPYIGYYDDEDNYMREVFNTNFGFDTQLPNMGLIFSFSFQCQWFAGSQTERKDPMPIAYVDKNLVYHPFTHESANDGILSEMIRSYNELNYAYTRIPFSMNMNIKVTKTLFKDKIALAIFANKLLDYSPSYTSRTGIKVRREVNPYFGMELNLKL